MKEPWSDILADLPSDSLKIQLERQKRQRLPSLAAWPSWADADSNKFSGTGSSKPDEPPVKLCLIDLNRKEMVQSVLQIFSHNREVLVLGYHLCAENLKPEDLHIDSLPPIPHVTLEEAVNLGADIVVIGMHTPYPVTSFVHQHAGCYVILDKPDCYAAYVFQQIPGYYEHNRTELDSVYALLDAPNRIRLGSVVQARQSGDSSYLVPSGENYAHRPTDAMRGDIVIDGGVYRFGEELQQFSDAVGANGHVYSFEPEPNNYRVVAEELKQHGANNITLLNLGLYSEKGELSIINCASMSSLVSTGGEACSSCPVISLDAFVQENRLSRVDLIKLDIEGAEMAALRGAAETIRQFRPRLKISAYHLPEHLWEIPLLLHELVPEYQFAFHTPAPHLVEYIYFAWPR